MKLEDFLGENYYYFWSDNWCLDDKKIWFMAGAVDFLFCLDTEAKETCLIDKIPSDNLNAFRQHPRCIKIKDSIICLPDNGKDIWFYHISNGQWTNIPLECPEGIRLAYYHAWYIQKRLYVVSYGTKQIVEIDVEKECIKNYYDFPVINDERLVDAVLIDDCIYVASSFPVNIYKFNCSDKSLKIYKLTEIDDQIQTLCFDGNKFWLSGHCRVIYIWKEDTKAITFLNDIPNEFRIWNFSGQYKNLLNYVEKSEEAPLFVSSVSVNNYVWFIPFQTNEILYVDKDTLEIREFYIKEENQTENDVKKQLLKHKYLLEYIKDDRYLGLFSLKNKWVFEIDCQEMKYRILNYELNPEMLSQIEEHLWIDSVLQIFYQNHSIYEQDGINLKTLLKCVKSKDYKRLLHREKNINTIVGKNIHCFTVTIQNPLIQR